MGQKDIAEKTLEAYNDVFADIINVLLFNGRQVLHENELEDQNVRSAYKADGRYREIERDAAKRWKNGTIRLASIGIENQTTVDQDMPLRVMAYDGAEYRAQLIAGKTQPRYPVLTVVLYFDHRKRWDGPVTLHKRLEIPDEFKPYVNDYEVNLYDISYLSKEQVALFKSDFRIVADYFVQKRLTGDYKGNRETIKHVSETLNLMSIMTQDNRFEQVINEKAEDGKEIKTMCEVLDRIEAKGRAEGKCEGENIAFELVGKLLAEGRVEDVKKAAADSEYKKKLLQEYKLS